MTNSTALAYREVIRDMKEQVESMLSAIAFNESMLSQLEANESETGNNSVTTLHEDDLAPEVFKGSSAQLQLRDLIVDTIEANVDNSVKFTVREITKLVISPKYAYSAALQQSVRIILENLVEIGWLMRTKQDSGRVYYNLRR